MKGLELSRRYYREICSPMLDRRFAALIPRLAAGLVGEGSECLGFDDELSRDHDWGPKVRLWLTARDYEDFGHALRLAMRRLPSCFLGYGFRQKSPGADERDGVLEIGGFYHAFLGRPHAPETLGEWLHVPEEFLATATNGAVFADPCGAFTAVRDRLLRFYPEDVRKKKLAARCATIAQAGQYNFPRCSARKEYVAAAMAEAAFVDAACSAVFLLNKRYKPFYKWMHRALAGLPVLGLEMYDVLSALAGAAGGSVRGSLAKANIMEEASAMLARELLVQGLSDSTSDFLLEHGRSIQKRIEDEAIRNIDVLLG